MTDLSEVAGTIGATDRAAARNRWHTTDLLDAAFGGRPDMSITDVNGARNSWLAAVVLGGQGSYAAAAGRLKTLVGNHDSVIAALAATTLASHLRQLGGHAQARRYDSIALHRLTSRRTGRLDSRLKDSAISTDAGEDEYGIGRTGALVDAMLGLAADAIGLGRPVEAARLHETAVTIGRTVTSWRVTVRIDWVAAELALATDRPAVAVRRAEHALAVATDHGAVRHVAKSIMIGGAAAAARGTPDGRRRAVALLTDVLATSLTRGIVPLAWPSALLLAELLPERRAEFTAIASDVLTSIFVRCDSEMRRISTDSPWMPGSLIRSGEPTRTGADQIT